MNAPTFAPLEAFVNVGKAGSDTFAAAEAIRRLVSLTLRMPSSLSRREHAEQIVAQLSRVGNTAQPPRALPDALISALAEHLHMTDAEAPTDAPAAENSRHALEARAPVTVPRAPSNLAPCRVAPKPAARAAKLEILNLSSE